MNVLTHSPSMQLFRRCVQLCLLASSLLFTSLVAAEDYYRWVGEDGVVHYGSTPPKGVDAVKIKTYSGPKTKAGSGSYGESSTEEVLDTANLPPEEIERRRRVAERQREVCEGEKERLDILNQPTRIRMKQPDGTTRVLTQDEIMKEIQTTKKLIEENCK